MARFGGKKSYCDHAYHKQNRPSFRRGFCRFCRLCPNTYTPFNHIKNIKDISNFVELRYRVVLKTSFFLSTSRDDRQNRQNLFLWLRSRLIGFGVDPVDFARVPPHSSRIE